MILGILKKRLQNQKSKIKTKESGLNCLKK
nr:MAG TPA: hypothetical protein [Caudoviricetes sp.]